MALKYIGNGFIHPYPARDLSDEEVKEFGKANLLATGLYEDEGAERQRSASRKSPPVAVVDVEKEGE